MITQDLRISYYGKTSSINVKFYIVIILLLALITTFSGCRKAEDSIPLKSEPDTCNSNFYKKILDSDSSLFFLKLIEHAPNHLLLYNINYSELTAVDSFFNVKWKKTYKGDALGTYNYLFEEADSGSYFLAVPAKVDSSLIFKVDGNGNQLSSVKTLSKVKSLKSGELISYQVPAYVGGTKRTFEINKFDLNLNLVWHYGDTVEEGNFIFAEGISDLYFTSERYSSVSSPNIKSIAHVLKISNEGIVQWEKNYQVNVSSRNQIVRAIENADKTLSLLLIDDDYACYLITTDSSGNVISTTPGNIPNSTGLITKQYNNVKLELDVNHPVNGCSLKKYLNNNQQWQNAYSLNVETSALDVLQSATGSIYIIGNVKLFDGIANYPLLKPFVIKTDAVGKTCY